MSASARVSVGLVVAGVVAVGSVGGAAAREVGTIVGAVSIGVGGTVSGAALPGVRMAMVAPP